MKPLKERLFWKIILGIISGIAFISVIMLGISLLTVESWTNQKAAEEGIKAKEFGYDKAYRICTREKELTLEGTTYILYSVRWSSIFDGTSEEEMLIRKDATYIDETEGKTDELIIYCKEAGYVNDPDAPTIGDAGMYKLLEPYKIAIYSQKGMWTVVGFFVIAGLIEFILVSVLIIYFVMYFVRKNKNLA